MHGFGVRHTKVRAARARMHAMHCTSNQRGTIAHLMHDIWHSMHIVDEQHEINLFFNPHDSLSFAMPWIQMW